MPEEYTYRKRERLQLKKALSQGRDECIHGQGTVLYNCQTAPPPSSPRYLYKRSAFGILKLTPSKRKQLYSERQREVLAHSEQAKFRHHGVASQYPSCFFHADIPSSSIMVGKLLCWPIYMYMGWASPITAHNGGGGERVQVSNTP